ncbi:hypothetical protein, partial [Collimonas silvisoli]|uniref:hypothetical protein n=1 Tax=Collimonas silvisoli TaxID=2825884 RepID=UPI001B8AD699
KLNRPKMTLPSKQDKVKIGQSPQQRLTEMGYVVQVMPGLGNDCALRTIYDQLVNRHSLAILDFGPFANYVRTHANLAFGSMIDILNNGTPMLNAVRGYLINVLHLYNDPAEVQLTINLWSAVGDGGLMQFDQVAETAPGADNLILMFYFNGVNHFDSLRGGPG